MHWHGHRSQDPAALAAEEAVYGRRIIWMKTASYAVMHLLVAIAVAYALTRNWQVALAIGLIEPAVQTVAYFFHDRGWSRYLARRAQAREQTANG